MVVILTQVSDKRKTATPARSLSRNSPDGAASPFSTSQCPTPLRRPQDPQPPCVTRGVRNKVCYISTLPSTQSTYRCGRVTGPPKTVSSHSATQRGGCVTMLGGAA